MSASLKVEQYQRINCPDCGRSIKITVGFTIPTHRVPKPFSAPTRDKTVCGASGRRLDMGSPAPVISPELRDTRAVLAAAGARVVELENALLRAYSDHGHKYNCSAARGMESDCTCGWLEIRQMVKAINSQQPPVQS